jgi:hypothetical protein
MRRGVKYGSWFLRVRNSAGTVVLTKSSSATLEKLADKITGLTAESYYDRKTFKPATVTP